MNGTTRCPHCETRFKISDAQLGAHQGMVRCGHCMQAFDARPEFIPKPYDQQPLTGEVAAHVGEAVGPHDHGESENAAHQRDVAPEEHDVREGGDEERADDHQAEVASVETQIDADSFPKEDVPSQAATADALDFSHLSGAAVDVVQAEQGEIAAHAEHVVHDAPEDEVPFSSSEADTPDEIKSRRTWPWMIGIVAAVLLLLAQSAYFFRVSLSAHMPALKPALAGYCSLLNCSVPLPKNAELISIESSGLEADHDHENQIAFNALLRNRAGYTLAFPVLALTLNDNQDKPLARRLFGPADYLPAGESEMKGFGENHEVSISLRLNTSDLRPVGYRLELFYN